LKFIPVCWPIIRFGVLPWNFAVKILKIAGNWSEGVKIIETPTTADLNL
jgi:hypothetical protein